MLFSEPLLVSTAVKPTGWGVVFGASAFGVIGLMMGLRVWHGKPVNPYSTLESERRFRILSIVLLPCAVVFFCLALIGALTELGAATTGVLQTVTFVFALLVTAVALLAFLVAASLFFFSRPKRFVPPHLRGS